MQLNLSLNNTAYPKKTKVQLDAYIYIYIFGGYKGETPQDQEKATISP